MSEEISKHPDVLAWEKWIKSEEGRSTADPTTLGIDRRLRKYLVNRLEAAFMAGVKYGEGKK